MTELLVNAPLSPSPPKDLHFSEELKAWIVSSYRDAQAALRSPDLSQARPPKSAPDSAAKPANEKISSDSFAGLVSSHASEWQIEITGLASALLQSLPRERPIELAAQFIRPWCLGSAIALTRIDPVHSERLAQLVDCLCASDAAPDDAVSKSRAKEANRELGRVLLSARAPYEKSMFLGIAQTVPAFLASAWAALLQHPSEWSALRAHPNWIPKATEELLRYAGIVHSVFRQADRETSICGTRIASGDRLILRLASANRDPQQFAKPNLLDFERGGAGHLALSSGPHYCAGASLVRMMVSIATQAMITRYLEPELSSPVEWCCGTMLIWASSLPVRLRTAP